MRSISSTLASPTPMAIARARISLSSLARSSASRSLESLTPSIRSRGGRMTAAATTGPASGPMPTSSTPAMRTIPRVQCSSSMARSDSIRRSSEITRWRCLESCSASWRAPWRGSRRSMPMRRVDAGSSVSRKRARNSSSELS